MIKAPHDLAALLAELKRRFLSQPWDYLSWYLIGKPVSLLSWTNIDGIGDIFIYPVQRSPYLTQPAFIGTRLLTLVLHVPLTVSAIVGCVLTLLRPALLGLTERTRVPALLVVVTICYFLVLHTIGAPYPRYGIPLRPLVYGFGLFTIVTLTVPFATRFIGRSIAAHPE